MRKSVLITAMTTALLSGMAFGVQAQTEPQGMYAADDILDADVFFANGSGEESAKSTTFCLMKRCVFPPS